MTDLVEFLRARQAAKAAKAQAALYDTEGRWTQVDPLRRPGEIVDDHGEIVTYDEGRPGEEQAAHIAENDPARVLREVEARRRIIEQYEALTKDFQHADETVAEHTRRAALEDVLELLAQPYADHPDYQQEWRP